MSEIFTLKLFVPASLVATLENSSFPTVTDNSELSADGFLIFNIYSFVFVLSSGSVTVILYVVSSSAISNSSVDIWTLASVSPIFTKSLSLIVIAVTATVSAFSLMYALYIFPIGSISCPFTVSENIPCINSVPCLSNVNVYSFSLSFSPSPALT